MEFSLLRYPIPPKKEQFELSQIVLAIISNPAVPAHVRSSLIDVIDG
jgi:hypothetical protein